MEETYSLNDFDRMCSKKPSGSISKSKDGNYAAVGIYSESGVAGEVRGAVYVFLRSGDVWTQQAMLVANDSAAWDYFGWSISISADGGYAIVGAYSKTGTYKYQGAAYVFLRSGTAWTQQAKLLASDPAAYDQFGWSVSISADGGYAIVGAYSKTGTYNKQGAAYVFLRSGDVWTQQAKLLDNNPNAWDGFSHSVVIGDNGGYTVIGDTMDAVILFKRIGTTWRQLLKIRGSQAQDIDYWDLAVEGY